MLRKTCADTSMDCRYLSSSCSGSSALVGLALEGLALVGLALVELASDATRVRLLRLTSGELGLTGDTLFELLVGLMALFLLFASFDTCFACAIILSYLLQSFLGSG